MSKSKGKFYSLKHDFDSNYEPTPKSLITLNLLKGTLENALIFNEFLFWD